MLDWDAIAPMIVAIVFLVTVGGVLILRPIAKRVSDLLEVYAREHRSSGELQRVRELLETMDARLRLMEERQDFTERLLSGGSERGEPDGRAVRAGVEVEDRR